MILLIISIEYLNSLKSSINEYVRRRRLTHSANELFYSNIRIVELATKYQFESQEALTRAFKDMFYMTPEQFRKQTNMNETLAKSRRLCQCRIYWYSHHAKNLRLLIL
ncbi:helix-turn-helix domain-containing protein [Bacillus sp. Xin]|nr:helix-turn-helix domain-containing protein [Bacillus sp. Xin]NSW39286.1 helix-turn-helix domain-containing protein [Bacillus sp. Xin1]